MNVLYVTANSHLRSTTSSLNAIIRELRPHGVVPVMWFRETGPWQAALSAEGWRCIVAPFEIPDKRSPIRALRQTWDVVRIIRRERIALIHCNEHEHYPMLRLAARLTGVPMVVSLHWNLEGGYGRWAFGKPYTPAALQFLSQAQLDVSRPALPADLPPDRVKLLMSGLYIDAFLALGGGAEKLRAAWGADNDTVVLGVAAAIKPRKHLEDFIRLVARLRRDGRPVLGVIAGGGAFADADYQQFLEQTILEEGVGSHCKMIGNMDPVTPFFQAIDIAVNPSEMEILSMSMCEAMACGRPMIAYAVGGNPETVHDRWCVVPFGDLDALTDRARRLVDDPVFRRVQGQAALKHVRAQFDAPALAGREAKIYCQALGERVTSIWPEGPCAAPRRD